MKTINAKVLLMSLLLAVALQVAAKIAGYRYTVRDEVSWAITRPDMLAFPYHQGLYDRHMKECNEETEGACQNGENFRLNMNTKQPGGVYNYTKLGFQKLRVPDELWELLHGFWERNKDQQKIEWGKNINPYHNMCKAFVLPSK